MLMLIDKISILINLLGVYNLEKGRKDQRESWMAHNIA